MFRLEQDLLMKADIIKIIVIVIIIKTITSIITLIEGAWIPSILLLLGSIPVVVVVDKIHIFSCFETIVVWMIISSTYLAPWIGFDCLYGGVVLDHISTSLECISFINLSHQGVHLSESMSTSLTLCIPLFLGWSLSSLHPWLETILFMSFPASLTWSEKKAPPVVTSRWLWANRVSPW